MQNARFVIILSAACRILAPIFVVPWEDTMTACTNDIVRRTPGVASTVGTERAVICGACGATYRGHAWASLALSERLEPREIRPHVSHWPFDVCVEVRTCGGCGRLIATTIRPGRDAL